MKLTKEEFFKKYENPPKTSEEILIHNLRREIGFLKDGERIEYVKGFEGRFMVTSFGRLFSINGRWKGIKEMNPGIGKKEGYKLTHLGSGINRRVVRVHTLVGEVFLTKGSGHNCINHKDGNKLNNHVDNLEWTTLGENIKHAVATGLMDLKGEKHHASKLTKEKVLEMRRLYGTGKYTHSKIGEMFGVCRRQSGDVINGVNWGWI